MTTSAERAREWRSQLYAARDELKKLKGRRKQILARSFFFREKKDFVLERYVFSFFENDEGCFTFPESIESSECQPGEKLWKGRLIAYWGGNYYPSHAEVEAFNHAAYSGRMEPFHYAPWGMFIEGKMAREEALRYE